MSQKANKKWPEPPVILKTFEYKDFKYKNNRELDNGNLNKFRKLVADNEFYPWKTPILVDVHHVIKDGQHRFSTCQEFGYPVYYIQDTDIISAEEVMSLNIAQQAHRVPDRLHILKEANSKLGEEVRTALAFWQNYGRSKGLSKTFVCQLLLNFNEGPAVGTALLDGTFKVECETETLKLFTWLDNLAKEKFKWEKNFIAAILKLMKASGDRELVYIRLKNNEGKITAEPNARAYQVKLLEIFNHGRKTQHKLILRKAQPAEELQDAH